MIPRYVSTKHTSLRVETDDGDTKEHLEETTRLLFIHSFGADTELWGHSVAGNSRRNTHSSRSWEFGWELATMLSDQRVKPTSITGRDE